MPESWNDVLSLIILAGVPALWIASSWLALPESVVGATIAGWMLVLQFYFRKSKPKSP